jgi:hypothetical protein
MKNMIKVLMLVAALAVVVLAQNPTTDAPVAEATPEEVPVSVPVGEPQTDAPIDVPVAEQPQSSGQEPLQYTTGGVIVFSVYTGNACSGSPTVGPNDLNNDFSECQHIAAQGIGNIYFRIACLTNDTVVGTTYGTTPGCSANANPLPSAPSGSCYPIPSSATGGIPMVFKGVCPSAPSTPTPVATPSEASSVLLSSFLIVTLSAVLLSFL